MKSKLLKLKLSFYFGMMGSVFAMDDGCNPYNPSDGPTDSASWTSSVVYEECAIEGSHRYDEDALLFFGENYYDDKYNRLILQYGDADNALLQLVRLKDENGVNEMLSSFWSDPSADALNEALVIAATLADLPCLNLLLRCKHNQYFSDKGIEKALFNTRNPEVEIEIMNWLFNYRYSFLKNIDLANIIIDVSVENIECLQLLMSRVGNCDFSKNIFDELFMHLVAVNDIPNIEILLRQSSQLKLKQETISSVFMTLCKYESMALTHPQFCIDAHQNYVMLSQQTHAMIAWFLASELCTEIQGSIINAGLKKLNENKFTDAIQTFLSHTSLIKPHKNAVLQAFKDCGTYGNLTLIKWLVENNHVQLSQAVITQTFKNAAYSNHLPIIKWIFSSACPAQPNQDGINEAFLRAVKKNRFDVVQWFLHSPELAHMRPSEATLVQAYRDSISLTVMTNNRYWIAESIFRQLPEDMREQFTQEILARENRGRVVAPQQTGFAHEIHKYSRDKITPVLENIRSRIAGIQLLTKQQIKVIFDSKFKQMSTASGQSTQLQNAKKTVNEILDDTSLPTSQTILTFVNQYHADKLDLFINSFINESVTAYLNSRHQLSCVAGMQERLYTCLRDLDDAELNAIFHDKEANLLFEKKLLLLALDTEAHKEQFASALYQAGGRSSMADSEIAPLIMQAILSLFESENLSSNQQAQALEMADYIPQERWKSKLADLEIASDIPLEASPKKNVKKRDRDDFEG